MQSARMAYIGKRVYVSIERHRLPSGVIADREIVRFPQSVAVVPLLNDEEIVLIRQYRPAVRGWIYEVPAGIIEEGEDPAETAGRELVEETGYEAGIMMKVLELYLAPGYSTELIHIFLAYNLKYVGEKPELHEVIEVKQLKLSKVVDMIYSGELNDAKTVASILFLVYNKSELLKNLSLISNAN
ncbi:MAG: NUDIX hydrolase [Sulfolobales archaeon]|nr:NUDIX hydrolase [Sulfolobales archaeon]